MPNNPTNLDLASKYPKELQDALITRNGAQVAFEEGMNLPSGPLALSLEVLGNKMVNQDTREYSLIINDMHWTRHSVTALGLESIAGVKHAPDVKILSRMFPNSNKDIIKAFDRPHGNVDVMLGMESRSLHFRDGYNVGNIRLIRSVFAPGWTLRQDYEW